MSVFKHKGGNIYYAGFGALGRYFVRSLGTSNRREAERKEKKLRALAEAGRLQLRVSADDRAKKIKKSLANRRVSRSHRASARAAAKERKADPEKKAEWIASIRTGQADPQVKALMIKANRNTAANPVSQRKKSQSGKKLWKRRGHKKRVSRSMITKWDSDEFRKKNLDGRDLAAAERLKQRGFVVEHARSSNRSVAPKSPQERGPDPLPIEETS
jgi:hypothetical protein